jgi:hypothetical protein
MFRFTQPANEHAPLLPGARLLPRFDGYPYMVSRIGKNAVRHIALLPTDWPRERIIALARAQAEANRFETAACFGPDDAEYVAFDTARTWSGPTPTGIYVIDRLKLPESLPETDELAVRQTWFAAFEKATRTGGYLVGDGTDRGEYLRPEYRARLTGRAADGLPVGLRRCEECGEAAGDYLRGGVARIRCYCACDNHNRCARCLTPLAAHRLSAWFWDDARDSAWHLAAYAAFTHRCPDERIDECLD